MKNNRENIASTETSSYAGLESISAKLLSKSNHEIIVFLGDKIIGINGTSIEGMSHDQAMGLLRDDEKPMLHLQLLKKALYKPKGMLCYKVCLMLKYDSESRVI